MSALLLCAVLVQSLAGLLPWGHAHAAEDLAHRFIHAEAVTHQHELDETLFLVPAQDSAFHLHEQDAGQPFALVAAVVRAPLLKSAQPAQPLRADRISSVFLEGPLRPPCLSV